jgi:hypothetical protein
MKKTTFLFTVIIAAIITLDLSAQDSIFDLKSYKTNNYDRSSLDLNFRLNEMAVDMANEQLHPLHQENNTIFNSGLDMQSEYSRIFNSRSKIINYGSNIALSENYQSSRIEQTDSLLRNSVKSSSYSGRHVLMGYYNMNSYYSPSNKNFFIIGGNFSLGAGSRSQRSVATIENKSTQSWVNADLFLKLGHGHGRIEYVEDAVEAMYILKELGEIGSLSRKFSEADIKALADKITLVRKERYFDERIYRKKSMNELVALLQESGLISQGNIDVFNTIADYHYYAGIQERPSGQKLEYYLTPGFRYENNISTSTSVTSRKNVVDEYTGSLGLTVGYSNYKPISIKWQRNIYANVTAKNSTGLKNTTITDDENSYPGTSKNSQLEGIACAGISYGFYPSTRSNLTAGISAQYAYSNQLSEDRLSSNPDHSLNADLTVSGYYYLSSKLRLSGVFDLVSNIHKIEQSFDQTTINEVNNSNIHNDFSLALTYYIF